MSSPDGSPRYPSGLRGDLAKLFSAQGTVQGKPTVRVALERAVTRPGPMAILLYRLGHWLWKRDRTFIAEVLWRVNLFLTGADIHPGAFIGGGLRLTHTSGLVIGKGARIGSNCNILHGVTIGGSGKVWFDPAYGDGLPEIGDDCEIWAGAKVLGPIKVGRGCHIGANAVLAHDLPDGASYTAGQRGKELRDRVVELEAQVRALESRLANGERPAASTTPAREA